VAGERVRVGGGPAGIESGEQHPAFEHELIGVGRAGEAGQPTFDHV
jgi:hypothetical protein